MVLSWNKDYFAEPPPPNFDKLNYSFTTSNLFKKITHCFKYVLIMSLKEFFVLATKNSSGGFFEVFLQCWSDAKKNKNSFCFLYFYIYFIFRYGSKSLQPRETRTIYVGVSERIKTKNKRNLGDELIKLPKPFFIPENIKIEKIGEGTLLLTKIE